MIMLGLCICKCVCVCMCVCDFVVVVGLVGWYTCVRKKDIQILRLASVPAAAAAS